MVTLYERTETQKNSHISTHAHTHTHTQAQRQLHYHLPIVIITLRESRLPPPAASCRLIHLQFHSYHHHRTTISINIIIMAATITTATSSATMPATSNTSTLLFQTAQRTSHQVIGLCSELGRSTEVIFRTKLIWMLALGPLAILADFSGMVSDTVCFCFAGLALIPCAERYVSFCFALLCFVFDDAKNRL